MPQRGEGRSRDRVARINGLPRTEAEVGDAARCTFKAFRNASHVLNRELDLPTAPQRPRQYIPQFASAVNAPERVRVQAVDIAERAAQTEANDVVVNYDPSGYAKNALKKYVPQLTTTYDTRDLHDDHPVRFTNEGLRLDHKPENAIEWYVKVPHHEDYHLWMPAQPNPDQRDWLEALNAGDAEMGESRLFERDGTWSLHVTTTRNVEDGSEVSAEERTSIGVDIGEASLVTVCHRDDYGCPTAPELWADEGKTVRRLRKTYSTAKRRLQQRGSERIAESFGDDLWNQIDDVSHCVTREVVEYAESVEKGIPVETVNPRNTSKECHVCGEVGYRPKQATFNCSNDACWMGEYQADVNGAVNIADR